MKDLAKIQLYRLIHLNNLSIYLSRQALHAPNHYPSDGLNYHTIHDVGVQNRRRIYQIPCAPGGTLHDYVPFYFGARSPMLLKLKSGEVQGYNQGQEPLIYLVTHLQAIIDAGCTWVFSDGQGNASYTRWFNDSQQLEQLDWSAIRSRQWSNKQDSDLKRKKQAECLIYGACPWSCIQGIAVYKARAKESVQELFAQSLTPIPKLKIWPEAYY